jgi:hypothetical protein
LAVGRRTLEKKLHWHAILFDATAGNCYIRAAHQERDMPGSPFFVQPCPSCGRQAKIDVNYLGLKVVCQHCDHSFVAQDSAAVEPTKGDPINYWIRIADQVLDDVTVADRSAASRRL